MREALVRFQPTQGQLGSNRDATIKLSPSASLPPLLPHTLQFPSLPVRFSGQAVSCGRVSVSRLVLTDEIQCFVHSIDLTHSTAVL